MRFLGNILWWFPLFGFLNSIVLFICGGLLSLTGVGLPIGLGLIQLSKFCLAPFSRAMVNEKRIQPNKNHNNVYNVLSKIVFVIYLPIGLIIFVFGVLQVIALCLTIIFIPYAAVIAKTLPTLFNPIGKICVSRAVLDVVEKKEAEQAYEEYQNKK